MSPVDEIKGKLKLEEIIAESLTLTGKGAVLSTKEHDSLKIWTKTQTWHRFSTVHGGDIFDWWQQTHNCDFETALVELAAKAGVELRKRTEEERKADAAQRSQARMQDEILAMAASHYHRVLVSHPGALGARRYCVETRGWDDATIQREQIGYVLSADNNGLSDEGFTPLHRQLREAGLHEHPAARAVLSIPPGMIVYCHRDERGRVVYLSGRSTEGKRHYNLPDDSIGAKQPYINAPIKPRRAGTRIMVEGQADAISLGMLGIDAVALCGLAVGELPGEFSHVGLDRDAAGQHKGLDVALELGPLTRIAAWDGGAKDAAEWVKLGREEKDIKRVIEEGLPAIFALAATIPSLKGEDRKAGLRRLIDVFNQLDEIDAADKIDRVAVFACITLGQFRKLIKARQEELKAENGESPAGECFEYSAGGSQGAYVWEQCITWTPDGKGLTQFVVRQPGGEIKYQKSVDVGGTTYIPYQPTLGLIKNRRIVLFPEKAEEYGSEKALNEEIRRFIHDFLDVDPFYERLASYYVMFSWLYDLFENLPYLRALGDYGTGKTRFIQTIGVLCYRPMLVSGASSVSPIFRLIDMFRGTLVVDEADLSNSDSDNEIVKIINVGYQKGGAVMRAEKEAQADIYSPEVYDVFGPKILATRKPFTDRAVESRCLTRRTTTQRPRPDIPYTLGQSFWTRSTVIRNKLLMYRLKNHRPIEIDHSLADSSVEPRLNQVTMALKSIIKDEEMRRDIDLFIRAYNDVLINDRQMTLPAVVVQALAELHFCPHINVLGEDENDFSMKGIADKAQELLNEIDPDTRLTAKRIGQILSEDLGMQKRMDHPRYRRKVLVYDLDELRALMSRYGIEEPLQQK